MSITLAQVFLILTIVGAINWGLVGLANFNLVATIFGSQTVFSRIVYVLVGISGIATLYYSFMVHPVIL